MKPHRKVGRQALRRRAAFFFAGRFFAADFLAGRGFAAFRVTDPFRLPPADSRLACNASMRSSTLADGSSSSPARLLLGLEHPALFSGLDYGVELLLVGFVVPRRLPVGLQRVQDLHRELLL